MKKVLIIGSGCILMKDDGIGVWVAKNIRDSMGEKGIETLIVETDPDSCIEFIHEYDFIFVIDAAYTGREPGEITVLSLSDAAMLQKRPNFQHEMNMIDLIHSRYGVISGCLVGIEPAEIKLGLSLSDKLMKSFIAICTDVENAILGKWEKLSSV